MQTEAEVLNGVAAQTEEFVSDLHVHEEPRVRVLIVEDNPGDARLIELMVAEAGGSLFEVEAVDRLSTGLRRLTQNHIGIVLLDLTLPDSHGLATFNQIHARVPGIPIIVLSGLNDTTMAVQAVHEGAQDFLIKGQVDGQLLVRDALCDRTETVDRTTGPLCRGVALEKCPA